MAHEIRFAKPSDAKMILTFIKELAHYEQLEHEVVGTVEKIFISAFPQNL